MIQEKHSFIRFIANTACRSLIEEVELTPKPGLVDSENTGAHQDLSIQLMKASAESLEETFAEIAEISYGEQPSQFIREEIAAIGRAGEKRMFEVTGGVNTHKGAIWAIGLLVSAASIGKGMDPLEKTISNAGEIARYPDQHCPVSSTNGGKVMVKYNVNGARGEAQLGFPHIFLHSLPMLKQSRSQGMTEENARLAALLSLIAHLDDTCILHRGGPEALSFAKKAAAAILHDGNLHLIKSLDDEFIKRNISPGGSADLLAATLFLDKIKSYKPICEV
ncbi:triphosphoribosyl-dephospho-CoA synthase MdcB [Sporosarcina sp. P13]|uniref:triphosphoribosyl-dephospho-CoA synthase n=1 Tax=Sporosarcina sp. P13 TaxID=2048263 RepID=UPI000C164BC0|nr:triphosphoribosyl-dephospho-CoA synthase [Sporosarcina sp. P13]PIC63199.1 triphosphoribosyl-dephospho-CoA synthase MdcB [Sporosarcina sp. P13]